MERNLPEEKEIGVLYHGTTPESASKILEGGLKSMNCRKVHLSTTKNIARKVGKRRTSNPIILVIDARKARKEGIEQNGSISQSKFLQDS